VSGANPVLTPLQRDLLHAFFAHPLGAQFFLTGGTALAAFYFQHRLSEDLDLFTTQDAALAQARRELPALARHLQCTLASGISTPTLAQFFLTRSDESVRLDLVRDVEIQFGERRHIEGIIVDALENIGANKIAAIFGRTDAKDFVDLYFILQAGEDFWTLLAMAKQKDTGLSEFYLAGMMRQVRRLTRLPRMIKPLELATLQEFFLQLADELLRRIKPK